MRPYVSGKYGRDIFVTVGTMAVPLSIDAVGAAKRIEQERNGYAFQARDDNEKIRHVFSRWWSEDRGAPSWEDKAE
jgi:hypothetical protein